LCEIYLTITIALLNSDQETYRFLDECFVVAFFLGWKRLLVIPICVHRFLLFEIVFTVLNVSSLV